MTFIEITPFVDLDCTVKTETGTYNGIIGGDDTDGISITNGLSVWVMDCESILAISENVSGSLSMNTSFLELLILGVVLVALISSFKNKDGGSRY